MTDGIRSSPASPDSYVEPFWGPKFHAYLVALATAFLGSVTSIGVGFAGGAEVWKIGVAVVASCVPAVIFALRLRGRINNTPKG